MSSASNCPLFPLCSPCVGFISQLMGWNPKAGCDGVHLQSAAGRKKKQMRTVNMQQEETFIPPPALSRSWGWSLSVPLHPCVITSLQLSSCREPAASADLTGRDFNTWPFPKARAPPVIHSYPSSSPSLAEYPDHQPKHSPTSGLYHCFQHEDSIRFYELTRKYDWMNFRPQEWDGSC